ncbi:MAG TPA: protein-L-isoaspartate(D-aspartate) O-methyltransferase [Gammaproteobacteria bacterium]|nr:protein-L-isoaspartate(D-aspartate) O-methyltransferase [Gammaproteobacteria bacterium]
MTSARTRDRLVERLREQGISDARVLERIRRVPRHLFVDEALASRAYEDTALPIGLGQTISQPWVVARMTEAIVAEPTPEKVLEVGSGCGYQAAVLAGIVSQVFGIERLAPLLRRARPLLRSLELYNAQLRHGDGWQGWSRHAPFGGILVAAAPEEVPEALLGQLAEGGRLVVPVGPRGRQELLEITRHGNHFEQRSLGVVSFVPLLGGTA